MLDNDPEKKKLMRVLYPPLMNTDQVEISLIVKEKFSIDNISLAIRKKWIIEDKVE